MTLSDRAARHARPRSLRRVLLVSGLVLCAVLLALTGATLATNGTNELRSPATGTSALLRSALVVSLALLLGELAVARMARTLPGEKAEAGAAAGTGTGTGTGLDAGTAPLRLPRSWATAAAVVGALSAEGQLFLLDSGGSLATASGSADLVEVYGTRTGSLAHLAANGFLFAALCFGTRRHAWAPVPLATVVLAEALRAHPEPDSPLYGSLLTFVHLTAACLWVGGLVYVLRATRLWRHRPAAVRALWGRYTRLAAFAFAAVAVTGTLSTLRRLPLDAVLDTAYGRTLLVKLALFSAVSALALGARQRLHGRRDLDGTARPARAESVALAGIVVVSAVLTVVPLPG
ncbi:CopD family protein [Streptomyces sp. N2-109]|uniref:CopD family protein n=1 Tax=Streptomyces gossypii TaxID=2883101 RepID=A0ABT2JX92_9ACTN|nr:CopD family protein [Streptomyces gossypii]MCT2592505.1 CopD family protein [Streptomyces gossypii]